jgi:hypothetical protein
MRGYGQNILAMQDISRQLKSVCPPSRLSIDEREPLLNQQGQWRLMTRRRIGRKARSRPVLVSRLPSGKRHTPLLHPCRHINADQGSVRTAANTLLIRQVTRTTSKSLATTSATWETLTLAPSTLQSHRQTSRPSSFLQETGLCEPFEGKAFSNGTCQRPSRVANGQQEASPVTTTTTIIRGGK